MSLNPLTLITTLMLLLAAALGGGVIALRLRQPMILGYIAGGVIVGNLLSRFINQALVNLVADSGVTLLLFTLGVEFSFYRLRRVLGAISWAAIVQILVCTFLFFFIFLGFGFAYLPALFLATSSALSSTALVIKLLSERGELETLPGELSTGWLVVQDLAVVPIMILLVALTGETGEKTVLSLMGSVALGLVKSGLILAGVFYLGRHGVPQLLTAVVKLRSREILLLVTIGLVFLAGLVTYALGLSVALGAFLAGLMVAETSQNHAVFAEVRPLRDLFAVVFFVSLGMVLPLSSLVVSFPQIIGLTILVVLVKSGVAMFLLRFLGYHRKTAFLVAISLSQISEFGFIISREGLSRGAIGSGDASLLVALTFLTIFISSPLIAYGQLVYYRVSGWLGSFKIFPEKNIALREADLPISDHVVICGYGRVGKYIGRALQMANIPFLVVDYNHHSLKGLKDRGIGVVYGDPADKEVLDHAQVDLARAMVIAIPDRHTQELVIANALSLNRRLKIICRTHHEEDQRHLKSLGVATVIQPEFEAAISIVEKLLGDFGVASEDVTGKVARLKIEHGVG